MPTAPILDRALRSAFVRGEYAEPPETKAPDPLKILSKARYAASIVSTYDSDDEDVGQTSKGKKKKEGFFSALFRRGVRTQTEAPADEEDGDNQIESTDSVANLNGLRSKSFLASAMARPSLTFAPSTNLSTGGSSDFLSTRFNNSSLDSAMLPPITISSTGVMRSARSSTVGASPPMCSPNHGSSLGFRSHVGAQLRGIDGGSAEGGSSEADDSAGGSPMHQQTFMLASTPFARMSMGDSILVKRSMGSMTSASRLSKQMSEGLTLGDGDAPFSCDDSVASFSVARTQSRTAMASRRAGGSGNIIAAALASPSGSGALNRGNPHPLNPNSNPGLQVSLNSPSTSASSGMAASGSQQSLAPTPPAVERPVIFGRRRAAPVRQETAPSLGAPERETGSGDGAWIPTAPMAPVPPTPLHRRSLVSTASSTPSATASNGPIPPSLPIAASGNTISGASTPNVFGSPPLNMSAKSMNGGTVGLGSQSYNGYATPSHYPGPGSIMGSMGQDTFDDFDDGCSVLGLVGGPQRADERIKALWAVQDATEKDLARRAQLLARDESLPAPVWKGGTHYTQYRHRSVTRDPLQSSAVNAMSEYDKPRLRGMKQVLTSSE